MDAGKWLNAATNAVSLKSEKNLISHKNVYSIVDLSKLLKRYCYNEIYNFEFIQDYRIDPDQNRILENTSITITHVEGVAVSFMCDYNTFLQGILDLRQMKEEFEQKLDFKLKLGIFEYQKENNSQDLIKFSKEPRRELLKVKATKWDYF